MSLPKKAAERRRSRRARLSARVGSISGVPLAMGRARDISIHGIFVEFRLSDPSRKYSAGDMLLLRFSLPNFVGPIDARAVVARIEQRSTGEIGGIGFDFLELQEPALSAIRAFVDDPEGIDYFSDS